MTNFTYENLKQYDGQQVGNYHGWNVISTTKERYWNRNKEDREKGAYLIYDDDNALVYMGEYIGKIEVNGNVSKKTEIKKYVDKRLNLEERKLASKDASLEGEVVYTTPKIAFTKPADLELILNGKYGTLADEIIDSVFGTEVDDLIWNNVCNKGKFLSEDPEDRA